MKSPIKFAFYAALVTALALPALSIGALAKDHDHDRGDRDHDRGDHTHYRGAPGPIVGAGLPVLAVGYGAYWLVRRYRRKSDNVRS
jgi:hypothetical protein